MRSKLPSASFTHLIFYYYLPGRLCYSLLPERCMRIIVLGSLHIVRAVYTELGIELAEVSQTDIGLPPSILPKQPPFAVRLIP